MCRRWAVGRVGTGRLRGASALGARTFQGVAVNIKHILAMVIILGLSGSSAASAAQGEETPLERARRVDAAREALLPPPVVSPTNMARPAVMPVLYAMLGAMQAWDVYSTSSALKAGAREANPVAGNAGSMIGLKAATTASTIFFAERMWKKNRVAAVALMVAINGATAAVSMHNMRNARIASGRR
jgi:hypothetical protein